jgi:hypothetical protein
MVGFEIASSVALLLPRNDNHRAKPMSLIPPEFIPPSHRYTITIFTFDF